MAECTVFVCITCDTGKMENLHGRGAALHDLLCQKNISGARIQPIRCMGGCEKPCAMAMTVPGKFTYLYGNLQPDSSSVDAIAHQVELYNNSADGLVARASRPALLKDNVLFRLPPAGWRSDDGIVQMPKFQTTMDVD